MYTIQKNASEQWRASSDKQLGLLCVDAHGEIFYFNEICKNLKYLKFHEFFLIFREIFHKLFYEILQAKKFDKLCNTHCVGLQMM